MSHLPTNIHDRLGSVPKVVPIPERMQIIGLGFLLSSLRRKLHPYLDDDDAEVMERAMQDVANRYPESIELVRNWAGASLEMKSEP